MLHKSLAFLVKDVDQKTGTIQAYWSSFNVKDDGADAVRPGAFTKTIDEWGPKAKQPRTKWLWQHETGSILCAPSALEQDSFGLLATGTFVKTTLGSDVLMLYEAGCINEHSIGYEIVSATLDRAAQTRWLEQIKLYEGSSVTWGMNSETPTVAVKSLDPAGAAKLQEQAAKLEHILRHGSLRSDELCASLERQAKSIRDTLATLAVKTTDQDAPVRIKTSLDALDALLNQKGSPMGDKTETETPPPAPVPTPAPAPPRAKRAQKDTLDFDTTYRTERAYYDLLEELGDIFLAFQVFCVELLMNDSVADKVAGAETSIGQFADYIRSWIAQAAQSETWADLADEVAAEAASGYSWTPGRYLMGLQLQRALKEAERVPERQETTETGETGEEPARAPKSAPRLSLPQLARLAKAGRAISGTNRTTLTKAADGIADSMQGVADQITAMADHHKSITDLLEATDPEKSASLSDAHKDLPPDRQEPSSQTGTTEGDPASADYAQVAAAMASLKTGLAGLLAKTAARNLDGLGARA